MMNRSYSDLTRFDSFEERFEYLKLDGIVGRATFGFDRWMNQEFYRSRQWKSVRDEVIVRDNGCDLGIPGYEIHRDLLVHHMNPMSLEDIIHGEDWILNSEYLITTSIRTHNAIHYGYERVYPPTVLQRASNDTKLW